MKKNIEAIYKKQIVSLQRSFDQKVAELSLLKELQGAFKNANLANQNEIFIKQLEIIKRYTDISSVSIMILDEEAEKLIVVGASGMDAISERSSVDLKMGEGIAGKAFDTQKTVYIPDVKKDKEFADKGTGQKGSLTCVPIILKESCIGILNLREETPNSYHTDDLQFFELIADQLAITVLLIKSYHNVLVLEKKRVNLSRYFSRGLADHLISDDRMSRLGGDLLMVTVLFADIVGFTSMVGVRPFEQVVEVLNRFFKTLVPRIFENKGMLDKFLGDGVMAVFGIPAADALDPVNAIRCALEIQHCIRKLKKSLIQDNLFPIDVSIGIASGIVLAGNIGSEEHMNYTVIGEPVNLAQRLKSISSPGDILISKSTSDLAMAQEDFDIELVSMGSVWIKGMPDNIEPMKVVRKI